jgi:hypothetical protein
MMIELDGGLEKNLLSIHLPLHFFFFLGWAAEVWF